MRTRVGDIWPGSKSSHVFAPKKGDHLMPTITTKDEHISITGDWAADEDCGFGCNGYRSVLEGNPKGTTDAI